MPRDDVRAVGMGGDGSGGVGCDVAGRAGMEFDVAWARAPMSPSLTNWRLQTTQNSRRCLESQRGTWRNKVCCRVKNARHPRFPNRI